VVPVGKPGMEGSPGIDAGEPAVFGAPAGLAPGRPPAGCCPVVPVGKPGMEGSPGIDAGEPAMFGAPAGLVPGRLGAAPGRPPGAVGRPGREGSPGIDAGTPAMSGEPAGLAPGRPGRVPGRPGVAWGRAEIGGLHWGGMEVKGRLGRLDTAAGLWDSGSSAIAPPPALDRCAGVH